MTICRFRVGLVQGGQCEDLRYLQAEKGHFRQAEKGHQRLGTAPEKWWVRAPFVLGFYVFAILGVAVRFCQKEMYNSGV